MKKPPPLVLVLSFVFGITAPVMANDLVPLVWVEYGFKLFIFAQAAIVLIEWPVLIYYYRSTHKASLFMWSFAANAISLVVGFFWFYIVPIPLITSHDAATNVVTIPSARHQVTLILAVFAGAFATTVPIEALSIGYLSKKAGHPSWKLAFKASALMNVASYLALTATYLLTLVGKGP